ncbi:P1 protein [Cowpea polerovirus 1]|uniref:p1 protein n=1 Tax=Cowpea polerovirus 1 TaxID=1913124 RepID=A0A1I9W791_9VIRU|nr:P1 protein [Cowpea polerovirus 1]APA23042.1 P1 protein [Cowpea polerovirus 1]AQV03229.1 P1 protein [Cowpea polerovirus 1]
MTSSVVLFFFFLLSCVGSTSTMPGVLTGQHSLDFPISWELPWNQTSVEHRGFLEPPTPPAKTEQYVERTYSALALGLWELLLSDTQKYCQEGDIILQHSWQYACETFNKTTLILFEGVLELLIRVWSFVIFAIFYTAWRFITQWTMHALLLLCLGLLTKISIRTLRFVLGDWLVSLIAALIVAIIKLPWTCFKTVFFKPFSGIKPEMAVKGFVTHDIHMKPPRDSQLLMAWDDGSHAGYATCIRLYNGTNALVTAAHCRKHEGFVVSTKTKNRIPINAFKPLCVDVKNDFALFEGPMEWESLLGCKAVAATPMYLIRKGSASHYRYVNGEWFQRYAQIGEIVSPAHSNKYALQVLSNTDEGDSGAGYFVGKNLVGIHLGASLTDNHNAMLPILPIPGLTIPDYQLETTAPEGKVFTSSIYEEALKATERTMKFIANLRSKGKEVWSDLVDDLDFDPEAAPRVHPESSAKRSGNARRGTDREPTGKVAPSHASNTPTTDTDISSSSMLEAIVKAVVAKIDTASIEKAVIDRVSTKTTKPRRRQRRNKQKNTAPTSPPSIAGVKTQRPPKPPVSKPLAASPNITSQNRKGSRSSGGSSSGNTHTWRPKQRGSVGPSSARKPNSRH